MSRSLYQLSRQIFTALSGQWSPRAVLGLVAKFWDAEVCWYWQGTTHIRWEQTGSPIAAVPASPTAPPSLAPYHVMTVPGEDGYLALARTIPWSPEDEIECHEVATLVHIALGQLEVQQQVNMARQAMHQVQSLVEERTAQYQSSQGLLAKMRAADRRRIEQLNAANQIKDDFISTISHELRTPLTSMSLAIKMLRRPDLDPDRHAKYLEILETQCTQEIDLINDLLTLQKLEAKQLTCVKAAVDLPQLLEPLLEQFRHQWAPKELQLQVTLPPSFAWQSDGQLVTRVVQELLTNAGKYAHPQTLVEIQGDRDDQWLELQFINRGREITPDEQDYIFEKFRRGAGVTQQAIAGTGLGLALVKSLTQLLGGIITVASTGTTPAAEVCFNLRLPIQEPEEV